MPAAKSIYVVKALSYRVAVRRYLAKKGRPELRVLTLSHLEQVIINGEPVLYLDGNSSIRVSFVDRKPRKFGVFNWKGTVAAKADLSDFDDMYRIVRASSPVYFTWTEIDTGETGATVMRDLDSYELAARGGVTI